MAAASTSSASGRIVVGWFPPERRGLAMGIRQMAQPLGVAVAAAPWPSPPSGPGVTGGALDPGRRHRGSRSSPCSRWCSTRRARRRRAALTANPYRAGAFLARVHGVSVLLVVPQFLVWTYSLTWLVDERGWSAAAAGALVAGTHVLGAVGRIAVGHLSDVVGSRVRPLRWVAVAAAATMALLAAHRAAGGRRACCWWSPPPSPSPTTASPSPASPSGPAPTGRGRALGVQNTAQYLAAAAAAPVAGLSITHWGYAATFAAAALCPAAAVAARAARGRHRRRVAGRRA